MKDVKKWGIRIRIEVRIMNDFLFILALMNEGRCDMWRHRNQSLRHQTLELVKRLSCSYGDEDDDDSDDERRDGGKK